MGVSRQTVNGIIGDLIKNGLIIRCGYRKYCLDSQPKGQENLNSEKYMDQQWYFQTDKKERVLDVFSNLTDGK